MCGFSGFAVIIMHFGVIGYIGNENLLIISMKLYSLSQWNNLFYVTKEIDHNMFFFFSFKVKETVDYNLLKFNLNF